VLGADWSVISKLELGVVACGGPGVGHKPNVYTVMCVPKRARATADQAKKHRYRRTGHSISSQKASTSYTDIERVFIDIEKSSISGYNDIEVLNFDIDISSISGYNVIEVLNFDIDVSSISC
jgi:hypothetical protein